MIRIKEEDNPCSRFHVIKPLSLFTETPSAQFSHEMSDLKYYYWPGSDN